MTEKTLSQIAKELVSVGKGILAADESTPTIGKRFANIGVENNEANRRAYRELLFSAPGIEQYISGVIMYDETIRQSDSAGVLFPDLLLSKGIIPGIKVDLGTKELPESPEEKITLGLDGLENRLKEYYQLGARFAKWRAVIKIGHNIPTENCIQLNMEALARYAKTCQNNKIVPIVEPEVLMDGAHSIEKCFEVTKKTLEMLFAELKKSEVDLSGMLLKPNMVIYSLEGEKVPAQAVGRETVECFKEVIPATVPGIVFLSGGQTETEACQNLDAIVRLGQGSPWKFSFSFGRALQSSALKAWQGKPENIFVAQEIFINRARLASMATEGQYSEALE